MAEPTPTVVGVCLADVKEERIVWRSRGRLARGKLTILDGDPGLGKSSVMMDWAARISRGDPLPDGEPERERGVLLMCAEDDPADTIRPRLRLMGADLRQIYLLNEIPDEEGSMRLVQLPEDAGLIEAIIRARDVGLVVIDPLSAYLAERLKINSDTDVRRALSPLVTVAQRTGASIVLLRHLNKTGSTNALYRGGGSIGIIATVRFGLMVAEDPNDAEARVLASTKSNIGPPAPSLRYRLVGVPGEELAVVEWLGVSNQNAKDLLAGTAIDEETRDENDDAVEWLRLLLEPGPRPAAEIYTEARKIALSSRSVKRAKKKLGVIARKQGFNGETEWRWELPGPGPRLVPTNSSLVGGVVF